MISPTFVLLTGLFVVLLGALAWRDHVRLRASRRDLLDLCGPLLEGGRLTHGADDFPRLEGLWKGRRVVVDLVPDTMTIRRLPQLWLSLTLLDARPGRPSVGALVRQAGTEFYALTSSMEVRLEPPQGFPWEVVVRGSGPGAEAVLGRIGPVAASVLADPKVKEIALTAKGGRLVWQAGEGRKGDHLLLRQAVFDRAAVSPEVLQTLLARLDALNRASDTAREAAA